MKSSYHWVWQFILNIYWVEKYPDPTENKKYTLVLWPGHRPGSCCSCGLFLSDTNLWAALFQKRSTLFKLFLFDSALGVTNIQINGQTQ